MSSLRIIFVAGDSCYPSTLKCLQEFTKEPIIDHWWFWMIVQSFQES